MTATLPRDVQTVFARFLTTEYTTVDAAGQPITWPMTPYYTTGAPCIDIETPVGYPKKANDARANPLVGLLFSDPTGSGLSDPPMVLVQGSALVDDRDLAANRQRYGRESPIKLPGLARLQPPGAIKKRMGWYFTPIYVHVRPERIYVWPHGDVGGEPELYDAHLEEVRSGHSEEPERYHAPPEGGATAWDARLMELGTRYPTAVLSLISPDGFPFSVRVPVRADAAGRRVVIEAEPQGMPLQPGLGCLTAHTHGDPFSWQQNFQVRGDLTRGDGGWILIPHKVLTGVEVPPSRLAALRANASKAWRFHRAVARHD